MRIITLVGGGFSGAVLAANLLRQLRGARARIQVLESRAQLGDGAAYGDCGFPCTLNSPAIEMSLEENPRGLIEYAQACGLSVSEADFLPRVMYGEYVRAFLAQARKAAKNVEFVHVQARASEIRYATTHHEWDLLLDDGRTLHAGEVVLTTGNPKSEELAQLRPLAGSPRYHHDPWTHISESVVPESVLVLGTGQAMVDVLRRLIASRFPPFEATVLSPHGRLPLREIAFSRGVFGADAADALDKACGSARRLFRTVRELAYACEAAGGDWREVIALVRTRAPGIWSRIRLAERARLLRHAKWIWDTHRHRVPPEQLDDILKLRHSGRLQLHAGRLVLAEPGTDGVDVTWLSAGTPHRKLFDRVFNCTGPDYRALHSRDPFVRFLLRKRYLLPDALSLGIRTSANCEVIGGDGRAIPNLYYLGPWLRARDWEATDAPELRARAERLAAFIGQRQGPASRSMKAKPIKHGQSLT